MLRKVDGVGLIVILTEVGEGVNRGSERSLKEVGFELRLEGWQGLLFFFLIPLIMHWALFMPVLELTVPVSEP